LKQLTRQAEELKATGTVTTDRAGIDVASVGLAGHRMAQIERKRVEAVVEALANLRFRGESVPEVAHDARNMVTALGLYCDLLEEPGVLAAPFRHYAGELRLVATASHRLVQKLLAMDLRHGLAADRTTANRVSVEPLGTRDLELAKRWELMPSEPIDNMAAEVLANRNLLAALAGPAIELSVEIERSALAVRVNGEDLTRILVNLIKNAAEAMPEGGRIQVGLREIPAGMGTVTQSLLLTVEDNGPGIPGEVLEKIFDSGYTTSSKGAARNGGWPASHRGLGLSITRSIIEAAGGCICAANRAMAGARFEIELPVRPH